jgi:hypothetical protein
MWLLRFRDAGTFCGGDVASHRSGKPVTSSNVYFVNCTFLFDKLPLSRALTQQLLASSSVTFVSAAAGDLRTEYQPAQPLEPHRLVLSRGRTLPRVQQYLLLMQASPAFGGSPGCNHRTPDRSNSAGSCRGWRSGYLEPGIRQWIHIDGYGCPDSHQSAGLFGHGKRAHQRPLPVLRSDGTWSQDGERKPYGGDGVSQSRDDCEQDREHDQHARLSAESEKDFTLIADHTGSGDRGMRRAERNGPDSGQAAFDSNTVQLLAHLIRKVRHSV